MYSLDKQAARVGVVFEEKGFRPVWFGVGSHKVEIKEIHYSWTEREANEFLYKFTVSDGVTFYELQLSTRRMQWEVTGGG